MPWGEALRLTHILASDPSSQVSAALSGWSRPASFEEIATTNLLEVYIGAHVKHPTPLPRPWDKKAAAIGAGTSMTVDEWKAMRAELAARENASARPRDERGKFVRRQP